MKRHVAVIYLLLLMAINNCYCEISSDESDSDDSEEYQLATGQSQKECGCGKGPTSESKWKGKGGSPDDAPESRNVHTKSNHNYTNHFKGSTWTVTNSNVESEVQPDSNVENRFGSPFSPRKKCRWLLRAGSILLQCQLTTNEQSDDVTGNGRPQIERAKTKTTTLPPDLYDRVDSNSFKPAQEGSRGTPMASQDGEQESHPFLATPPNCGISLRDRIIGGTQSIVGKWPWMVAFGFRDQKTRKEFVWMCGGSLVTSKHIITVAHCLTSDTHYMDVARIGDVNLNSTLDAKSNAEERKVNRNFIIHPEYSHLNRKHDIAVVTVKEPFGNRYNPICLPFTLDMKNNQFNGGEAYVAGWGATSSVGFSSDVLLDVKLPIVDNGNCTTFYSQKRVTIDSTHICAGGEAGKDSCRGDSGGPLMIKNDSNKAYYLIGVVAFGASCGQKGAPGVYTRITSHMSWLEENLKNK